jgi:serine/threonine-protein kinase
MTDHQADAWEPTDSRGQPITIGRYILHRQIARGGMATIHIARLMGDEGFSRIVAAKRLLPEFAEDGDFVAMFLDEARVASKVHHRNVVPVLDLVTTGDEVILVQEYVHGAPLHWLLRTARQTKAHVPVNIAVSIACQVLSGLQAAHETVDEIGMPLNIVHRDVSPQNIMISQDGTARLLDFGVAKATMAAHVTREHTFKGKLAYSAPEQLRGAAVRQSDIYSLAVVLWELIVGHRMHHTSQAEQEIIASIMMGTLPTITQALEGEREWIAKERWKQLEAIEPIVKAGLAVELHERFTTAAEMEAALAAAVTPATPTEIAAWLKSLGREFLEGRERLLAAEEASWRRVALPGRLTPAPTEPRRPVSALRLSISSTAMSQPGVGPRRTTVISAVLGAAVVLIGFGLVFALKGGDPKPEPPPASITPLPAATLPAPPPAPAPAAADPAAQTVIAPRVESPDPPAPMPPVVAPPAPAMRKTASAPPPRPAPPRPAVVARPQPPPAAKQPPKATTPPAATATAVPPPSPPVETPAAKPPATDCNPPYYFEGSKKIFKPACL